MTTLTRALAVACLITAGLPMAALAAKGHDPQLADLDRLLAPSAATRRAFVVMPAATLPLSETALQTGTLLAQGVALRDRNRPVAIDFQPAVPAAQPLASGRFPRLDQTALQDADGILYGTRGELAHLTSPAFADRVTGPFLGVYPADTDPGRLLVVISGRTTADVETAAKTFAWRDFPFPAAAEALVQQVSYPSWSNYTGAETLAVKGRYTFAELGVPIRMLTAGPDDALELTVAIPPDLALMDRDQLVLQLHLALESSDGAIDVLVNGGMATTVRLPRTGQAVDGRYRVALPLKSLHPGRNTLRFQFHAPAGPSATAPDGPRVTVLDDSTVSMPALPHYVEMPNLQLFGRAGFPYTVMPDGRQSQLLITQPDRATIAAAWTLAGKLAQLTGIPMYQLQTVLKPRPEVPNLLVVGPTDCLPSDLAKAQSDGWLAAAAMPGASDHQAGSAPGEMPGSAGTMLATQFQNPAQAGGTVTMFTAPTSTQLQLAMAAAVHPGSWETMAGGRAHWDGGTYRFASQAAGETYAVGRLDLPRRIGLLASQRPWEFLAAVITLLGLTAWAMQRRLLQRIKEKADETLGYSA